MASLIVWFVLSPSTMEWLQLIIILLLGGKKKLVFLSPIMIVLDRAANNMSRLWSLTIQMELFGGRFACKKKVSIKMDNL